MSKAQEKQKPVTPEMLGILKSPVVTEKSTLGSQYGQVTFRVDLQATKPQIKAAVESIYKVKVKGVNTIVQKGKTKMFRGTAGRRSDEKKAIVTLEPGQQIDVTTGV
jgi:large subunit ribosomal protein L23